jgi:hypothetical protein
MELGKQTGSVVNHLLSGTVGEPTPTVGMGATVLLWTDRHAATVVKVTRCTVSVQRDKATRTNPEAGMSESQSYSYEPDPTATVEVFRKTKAGWRSASGRHLRIGDRREYHDYSF